MCISFIQRRKGKGQYFPIIFPINFPVLLAIYDAGCYNTKELKIITS